MTETIYSAHSPLLTPRRFLGEIKADMRIVYHVGWQLFVRNLKVQVRQNLLGYVWMVLPPLVTGLVWMYLGQAKVLKGLTSSVPYPVFVLTGLFLWQGFVEALNCPLQQLQQARSTISKVRVPHEAFIVAGLGAVLFNSTVRMLILLIVLIGFQMPWHATMLLAPLGLAVLVIFGLGLGYLLAPVGLLYADIANALPVVINLWFLITPIVYSPPASMASIIAWNPVTPLLTTTRDWLLMGAVQPSTGFTLVALGSCLLLLTSWLLYRLAKPHLIVRL
ncbi:ABC transporter permease [Spirosoma sp. RP8]|uniref:ABC transporter permease n=1 Tax=Spirosoma liriopis TaxID=2937440 RepID=A0ABT0HGK8_9BACT|nr:ABC transporter permease [Spirosoma liriopis]MCK8491283.1 ABC transporter permease [Spirosoma liriopis]